LGLTQRAMFGRFLELSIATQDIAASVGFYERLGFTQLLTADAWPHRYGVLSDGRIHLGLHECAGPNSALGFVLPELQRARAGLTAAQFEPEQARLGEDELHQLRLRDPGGHAITLLEARTYSPSPASSESLCGYFLHYSLPQSDFERARGFWERAGFVALSALDDPYPHMPLTSDRLDLAFHRRRLCDAPLLVFACEQLEQQRARLQALEIPLSQESLGAADGVGSALIEAPEGTLLWMLGVSA
jgi:catechol 2,3-dioxygenase-like lactoylglutathione lyase family enzyme